MTAQPNFLIVMSDQHAPGTIGGLGHPAVRTPNLDRLMARGVTFQNAYCPYPMCTPSRASFMTGHLTTGHGVWELGTPLRTDLPTWAHVLRKAGYTTSISGRMHFVGHDKLHGFSRRVHPESTDLMVPYIYGDWDKPQADDHVMVEAIQKAGPTDEPTKVQQFDENVTEAAIHELSHLASHPGKQPWALTVGMIMPHIPYTVSRKYYDLYKGVEIPMPRVPPDGRSYEEHVPAQLQDNRKWLGLTSDGATEEQVRVARRSYYGMITHMDELVGRLVAHLTKLGVADNTWVIYLSDHGDNHGEHGFWSKLNFYEDSVRIPMIIVSPRCAHPGARCAAPVSLIDWMSTVLDLTGEQERFEKMTGRSLLPLLAEPTQKWPDREIISDYACDGTRVPMRMVRRGQWKACFAQGFPSLLFDLENDPHEWNDLGSDPGHRGILDELEKLSRSDGWNAVAVRDEILRHKRRIKFISAAEKYAE